ERALRFTPAESVDAKLDKLESLVVGHYRRPREDVRFIADLLSVPSTGRYGPIALSARRHKEESMPALVELTEAAARMKPTIVLTEDAHWADPSSLEMLDILVDRMNHVPLLLLLTHRPEFESRWTTMDHVTMIDLSRLKRDESRAIISRLTSGKSM